MTAAENLTINPSRYYRPAEAGQLLGYSVHRLEQLRTEGGGPLFKKPSGKILYKGQDLIDWLEGGTKASTSD